MRGIARNAKKSKKSILVLSSNPKLLNWIFDEIKDTVETFIVHDSKKLHEKVTNLGDFKMSSNQKNQAKKGSILLAEDLACLTLDFDFVDELVSIDAN